MGMRMLVGAVLALAWGCGPTNEPGSTADGIRLSVEPGAVVAGDSVTLILGNGSQAGIGYNLCTSELERRTEDGWQAIPSDRVCTMELRALPAGEETRYALVLPSGLAAGEYRYRAVVERLDTADREVVRSGTFTVDG